MPQLKRLNITIHVQVNFRHSQHLSVSDTRSKTARGEKRRRRVNTRRKIGGRFLTVAQGRKQADYDQHRKLESHKELLFFASVFPLHPDPLTEISEKKKA
jgi:hypothetical protein